MQQRDLEAVTFADAGDLDLSGCTPEAMAARVGDAVGTRADTLSVLLGGEHTITAGAVAALAERYPDLGVVVLDAHLDLRDEYDGRRWSHATTIRRIADRVGMARIGLLGVRSGTREEWAVTPSLAFCSRTAAFPTAAWAALAGRPLYLSVDVDAFDPGIAPGTGNPEPLGLRADEFVTLLSVLRETRIVACDVVEVSPPYDPGGQTAMLAAWLVREMLLAFTR